MANEHIIKSVAPFLDPHVLLKVLKSLESCGALAKSFESKILLNHKDKNTEQKKATAEPAKKMIALFDDTAEL